ncbi:hypothetical protein SAMN04488098_10348 [Alkalibacterium thalassium]|uniref:Uncharacterized protein n=1 Tax=Alkalibacterium thalassium TaxID=426701 RepID=A0A1G9CCJ6_9LACT|nr:hypothetical protein SAMN04488098_10348 [Alkalibacterium thalassium]
MHVRSFFRKLNLKIDPTVELKEDKHYLGIVQKDYFDRFAEETFLGYDLRLDD